MPISKTNQTFINRVEEFTRGEQFQQLADDGAQFTPATLNQAITLWMSQQLKIIKEQNKQARLAKKESGENDGVEESSKTNSKKPTKVSKAKPATNQPNEQVHTEMLQINVDGGAELDALISEIDEADQDQGQVTNEPTVEDKPKTPTVEDKPKTPTVEDKPKTPTVEDKSKTPTVEDKPKTPTVEDKPKTPTVEDKPKTPTVEDKPKTPTVEDKPKTPTVEEKNHSNLISTQTSSTNQSEQDGPDVVQEKKTKAKPKLKLKKTKSKITLEPEMLDLSGDEEQLYYVNKINDEKWDVYQNKDDLENGIEKVLCFNPEDGTEIE